MSRMSFSMSQISTFISRANSARWLVVIAVTTAIFSSACGGEGPGSPPVSSPTPPQPTGPGTPAISETGGIPAGFRLVWSDEFAVAGLPDATKWNYDTERNAAGWYNNELQYYGNARARELERRERPADDHRAARGPIYCRLAGLGWPAVFVGAAHHARQGVLDLRLLRSARQTALRRRHLARDLDAVDAAADALAGRRRDRHHGARGLRCRASCTPPRTRARSITRAATTAPPPPAIPDACNEFHRYQMTLERESHHRRRRRSQLLPVLERRLGQRRVAVRQPAVPDPQYRRRRRLGRPDGRQRRHLPGAHGNRLRARLPVGAGPGNRDNSGHRQS